MKGDYGSGCKFVLSKRGKDHGVEGASEMPRTGAGLVSPSCIREAQSIYCVPHRCRY